MTEPIRARNAGFHAKDADLMDAPQPHACEQKQPWGQPAVDTAADILLYKRKSTQ